VGKGLAIVGFFGSPELDSGCGIDGHNGRIIGRQKKTVLPQRDIAGGPAEHLGGRGEIVLILPDQLTGCGFDRLNLVVGMGQEHDPVSHQRGRLVATFVHGHRPAHAQPRDVISGNIDQWAVRMAVRRSPPVQPVCGVRPVEFLGRHGFEIVNASHRESARTARHIHDASRLGKLHHLDVVGRRAGQVRR